MKTKFWMFIIIISVIFGFAISQAYLDYNNSKPVQSEINSTFPDPCQSSNYFENPEKFYFSNNSYYDITPPLDNIRLAVDGSFISAYVKGNDALYTHVIKPTGSMRPTLGDYSVAIYIKSPKKEEIHICDIVDYIRGYNNEPITHRIIKINDDGTFITKGDNNKMQDNSPVNFEQIKGKLVGVFY